MVSLLLESEVDGQRLTEPELLGALTLILVAGLDTVWSVLSNTLRYLATDANARRRLAAEPDLIPAAVEEFLRMFAPAAVARVTTCPVAVDGVEIGGTRACCWRSRPPTAIPRCSLTRTASSSTGRTTNM